MTYPKKFFWIYLTTITLFLVGLQHMQTLNSSRTSRTCKTVKKVKRSCKKTKSYSYEFQRFSQESRVQPPLPISAKFIRYNDFHYSIFVDKARYSRINREVKTRFKVGKKGEIISVQILGDKGRCRKKKRRVSSELPMMFSQKFIPGTINGKPSEFWVNIDFKY